VSGGRSLTLDQWFEESATDSFLVMHKGQLVYERYFNGQQAHTQHQMFSATKSFIGTLTRMLVEEGQIDPARTMGSYIPELKGSAFEDATVQQVLDMTTSIEFSEVYADPNADIWAYGFVFGISDVLDPAQRKSSIFEYLPTLGKMKQYAHGDAFHYVTPNTDVLGWLLSRVSGQSIAELLATRFWQPMGMERDAYVWLDRSGREMAGGGLNMTARDAARFGQMVLQGGEYNGVQVVSPAVARRILTPGNAETFSRLYNDPWYTQVGHSYHDQWWSFNNPHKAVSAIGVHGQFIYIDPVAQMVVVKQSSHPEAEGESNEVDGPLIWQAMAERLMQAD
jgi:CubicO group peptidase (beta-lactamase class C family)